jgi:hypothetical protein
LLHKVVSAETKDLGEGRIRATVSTEARDRDGDVIRQAGWQLDHFTRHPVLLSSHNYSSLSSQIGEWEDVRVRGKALQATAKYYIGEGNDEADWGYKLAQRGRAAYSVGFIPRESKPLEKNTGGLEFLRSELLEISHVTIPSNPEALQSLSVKGVDPALEEQLREAIEIVGEGRSFEDELGGNLSDLLTRALDEWMERSGLGCGHMVDGEVEPQLLFAAAKHLTEHYAHLELEPPTTWEARRPKVSADILSEALKEAMNG